MESTIELSVLKKEIHFVKKDSLTTGQQRNSMKISFNGKEWNRLTKYGVFKVEDTVKDVLITNSDIEIPAEVCTLDNLGKVVYFGIKGTYTETIGGTETETVYTTPYFRLGVLERGTETSGSIPEYPTQNAIDAAIENARRWAVGPSSIDKVPSNENNAKYWSEQAKKFANIFSEAGQLVVKDKYTTLEKLRDANPNHAYTYQVEQPNGELYIYSDAAKDWVSIGAIKGHKGEKGDKGDKGEKGDTGASNVLTIGSVTSGAAPAVTITGDSPNQVLNFVLEKGDKGEQGEPGARGEKGDKGDKGEKGEKGNAFTYADFTPDQLAALKGEKGDKGEQGEPGPAGKDGITPEIVEGELVTVPSAGGGGETWEKIAEIVIPEGADESTALTISKDFDGNPFSLVKARLCAKFPKYTGVTTIPNFSFAMLNGKTGGRVTPLAYTSAWPKVSMSVVTGTVYEIDVSGVQQIENVVRPGNQGWSDDSAQDYVVYGGANSVSATWYADTLWAKPITSVGGTNMLIYPGCRFVLYGVRARA